MVITQTPLRMSFFGGGTDFPAFYKEHGGSVISTSFDKYCYVTVKHLPPFFDYSTQITYGVIERVNSVDEIKHPSVREAMKYLDMRDIRLVYEADLPARSGLASSSAFAVGMLNAFHLLKGKYVSQRRLAEEAIYLERTLCAESGGVQDQIACAVGGFNRIDFSADGFVVNPVIIGIDRKKALNSKLMLFFTGFSRYSSEISVKQEKAIVDKTAELLEMKQLVDEAEKILTSKSDLDDFGRLLDHSWQIKRGLTSEISTESIDEMYARAKKNGAVGGKLLGAGGGGFLLIYADEEVQPKVREALSDLLYVPFEFETGGTRIMYYNDEKYDIPEETEAE